MSESQKRVMTKVMDGEMFTSPEDVDASPVLKPGLHYNSFCSFLLPSKGNKYSSGLQAQQWVLGTQSA